VIGVEIPQQSIGIPRKGTPDDDRDGALPSAVPHWVPALQR
jgi:hypothetical protein